MMAQEQTETFLRCWIYPRDPPSAQPYHVARPILDRGSRIATASAPPAAHVDDVLEYLSQCIDPHQPLQTVPHGAQRWSEVAQVVLPIPIEIRCSLPYDLRRGVWEPYMIPRAIPLLHHDLITARIILPRNTPAAEAQRRIREASDLNEMWQLLIFAHQWVVLSFELPHRVRQRLRQLERMQSQQRGGMRRSPDPRTQFIGAAQQRAHECVPQANPLTIAALLRAEHKSVGALLNCRTPEQVKHCLTAVYRRAGLPPPASEQQHTPPSQPTDESAAQPSTQLADIAEWMKQLMETMTNHTASMTALMQMQMESSTSGDALEIKNNLLSFRVAQQTELDELKASIQTIANKMSRWENEGIPIRHGPVENISENARQRERSAPYGRDHPVQHEQEVAPTPQTPHRTTRAAQDVTTPRISVPSTPTEPVTQPYLAQSEPASASEDQPVASVLHEFQRRSEAARALQPFRSGQ